MNIDAILIVLNALRDARYEVEVEIYTALFRKEPVRKNEFVSKAERIYKMAELLLRLTYCSEDAVMDDRLLSLASQTLGDEGVKEFCQAFRKKAPAA